MVGKTSKASKASNCLVFSRRENGRSVVAVVGWLESLLSASAQPSSQPPARSFASVVALLTGLWAGEEVTMTASSSALPECVMSVDDVYIDYGNGTTRACVVESHQLQQLQGLNGLQQQRHINPWFCTIHRSHDLDTKQHDLEQHDLHRHRHLIDSHSYYCHHSQLSTYPAHVRPLLPSASTPPSAPFKPIHFHYHYPLSTQHDGYDADEELESDDEQRGTLSSSIHSLSTTMSTPGRANPLGKHSTPPSRWLTKGSSMPTLRRSRSSLSSSVHLHTLLHPPSIDDHPSPDDTLSHLSHLPIHSPYTTASSTEDGHTTGSEDLFTTSSHVLRLDEDDSFLLDDDPDPFANYLSRARSSLSINSSHPDHIHAYSHPRTRPPSATTTVVSTQTQPKPFLPLVPTYTSRAQKRFSSTGPPTWNGSMPRHRLLNRPSLPSLGTLAQKFGTSLGPNLPTTNEHVDLNAPILLAPSLGSPFMARFPVDQWKHPDGAVASRMSTPSVIGGRQGEAVRIDADAGYLPVVWNGNGNKNNANASLSTCPYSDGPDANVTRCPNAASSDRGTSSFVAGSGSGSSRQYQQNYNAYSNQHSYSGGGMGGGGGTGGGRGGGSGGDRSDEDHNRKPRRYKGAKSDYSTDAYTTTTTEDEKQVTHRNNGNGNGKSSSRSGNATTDSDDTPLAHRLPGALSAQKSLRRQVREDQDMQRQVRARARAKSAPRQLAPPSRGAEGSGGGSMSADELTKKLLKVQVQSSQLPFSHENTPLTGSPSHIEQHASTSTSTYNKYTSAATPPRPHWLDAYPLNKTGGDSSDRHFPHMNPVARPNNATQPNTPVNMAPFLQFPHSPYPLQQQQQEQQRQVPHSLQRAMTSAKSQLGPRSNRPPHEMPEPRQRTETLLTLPLRQRANTLSSPAASRPTTSSATTPTTPAIPPLPTTSPAPAPVPVPTLPGRGFAHSGEGGPTMQQRVFVGDLQHFSIVEIGQSTKARDVIAMVDEKGELPHEAKAGGWMLFELSNDFGMGE